MIFSTLNPQKIWLKRLTYLFTSLVSCSHYTFWNPEKSFLAVLFIHIHDYLHCLRKKLTHLPTTSENIITLTYEMQKSFIWQKVCCIPSNVCGSAKSQLCIGTDVSEKNWLWCDVATGMPGRCSEWLPSAWIHTLVFFTTEQSHRTPPAEIQPMSAAPGRPYCTGIADWSTQYTRSVAYPRRGNMAL